VQTQLFLLDEILAKHNKWQHGERDEYVCMETDRQKASKPKQIFHLIIYLFILSLAVCFYLNVGVCISS
jgi:hypothetical protein